MKDQPTARNGWRGAARTLGVLAVLAVLLALAVGISIAAPAAPNAPDAPLGKASIGDCIWSDGNWNALEDISELGINGVLVNLYKDGSGGTKDGIFNETTPISFTHTGVPTTTITGACAAGGYYNFNVDGGETYFVEIDPSNFGPTGALKDYVWTSELILGTSGNPQGSPEIPPGATAPKGIFHARTLGLQENYQGADFGFVKVDLRIRLGQFENTNPVNLQHTVNVTVEQKIGAGAWTLVNDASVIPAITITGASTGAKTPDSNTCTSGIPTGTCTVKFNSSVADVYTVSGSVTANINLSTLIPPLFDQPTFTPIIVSRSRTTGVAPNTPGGNGGTGTLTKTYVDLRISISPLTATNQVGEEHIFTVKVEQKIGTGAWTAVPASPVLYPAVTITGSPAPTSTVNECDNVGTPAGTDANGECKVKINSNTATVYTANASVTATVSTETITRSTNSADGAAYTANNTALAQAPTRTGQATKIYVDLRIQIGPPSETNPVGVQHTFTITIEQKVGNGAWTGVSGLNPSISYSSPAPQTAPPNCGGTTDGNGVCTVIINNPTAGTFTVNASITHTVNSETMARDTDPNTGTLPGQGGYGPAVKIYVGGSIGDFVWWDINFNGVQDAGEPGINGVTVKLFSDANCIIAVPGGTTVTANGGIPAKDGYYNFGGLGVGTYCVEVDIAFAPLIGWTASPPNPGNPGFGTPGDAVDSDAVQLPSTTRYQIKNISINPVAGSLSQDNPTNDFGFDRDGSYSMSKVQNTDKTDFPFATPLNSGEPNVGGMSGVGLITGGSPVSFTITVNNNGPTTLTKVPLQDTYNQVYMQFVEAKRGTTTVNPNSTSASGNLVTLQWNDILGGTPLTPGQSVVLIVYFTGIADTTQLTTPQAPCNRLLGSDGLSLSARQTCNSAEAKDSTGKGPSSDPDGTGTLPGNLDQLTPLPNPVWDEIKLVNPTAVSLADYGANMSDDGVVIRWTTVNETEFVRFNVYRINGQGVKTLVGSVDAQKPGQADGANYTMADTAANGFVYGEAYDYVLEAEKFSGGIESQMIAGLRYVWLANIKR